MIRCLSGSTIRWFIYSSCLVILGIGAVLVWVGYLVQSSLFVQLADYTYVGFVILACGVVIIFVAFLGIIGAWKQRRFYLTLYVIFSIVVGMLLAAFSGVMFYARNASTFSLSDKEACKYHFPDADYVSELSASVLCKLYCPCKLDPEIAKKLNIQDFYQGSASNVFSCNPCENIQTYNPNVQKQLITWIYNKIGDTVNVTECALTNTDFEVKFFGTYSKYIPFVTWMEDHFKCSGLCTSQEILFFTDVSSSVPKQACFRPIKDWIDAYLLNYAIVSLILAVYQIGILYFAVSLCLCPKRKIELPPEGLHAPAKSLKA